MIVESIDDVCIFNVVSVDAVPMSIVWADVATLPIVKLVEAPAKLTVVAVSLIRLNDTAPVVISPPSTFKSPSMSALAVLPNKCNVPLTNKEASISELVALIPTLDSKVETLRVAAFDITVESPPTTKASANKVSVLDIVELLV